MIVDRGLECECESGCVRTADLEASGKISPILSGAGVTQGYLLCGALFVPSGRSLPALPAPRVCLLLPGQWASVGKTPRISS
jgi:hypothetical protein